MLTDVVFGLLQILVGAKIFLPLMHFNRILIGLCGL